MSLAIHLGVLILGAVIVLATLVCLVIDMVSRVDYLKEKFPRFARILERRDIIGALALAGVLLFLTDLYEVIDHEIPVVQGPVFQVNLPAVPISAATRPLSHFRYGRDSSYRWPFLPCGCHGYWTTAFRTGRGPTSSWLSQSCLSSLSGPFVPRSAVENTASDHKLPHSRNSRTTSAPPRAM